jgi:hypothetical protein
MNRKKEVSPFEEDTWKRIQEDSEFASAFFEDLSERPITVQFATLRRLQGLSQEKVASKLHRRQNYISKLEKAGEDHLVSHYQEAVKHLHGRLAIVPERVKFVVP